MVLDVQVPEPWPPSMTDAEREECLITFGACRLCHGPISTRRWFYRRSERLARVAGCCLDCGLEA